MGANVVIRHGLRQAGQRRMSVLSPVGPQSSHHACPGTVSVTIVGSVDERRFLIHSLDGPQGGPQTFEMVSTLQRSQLCERLCLKIGSVEHQCPPGLHKVNQVSFLQTFTESFIC